MTTMPKTTAESARLDLQEPLRSDVEVVSIITLIQED